MRKPHPIDIEVVRASISYNSVTGVFRWLIDKRGHRRAGDIAGSSRGGYWRVKINQRAYTGGRLAWALYYGRQPRGEVDHRDGNPSNNRISNLREATHLQNCQNIDARGIRFEQDRNKWLARIGFRGKQINLGRFAKEEDALRAYAEAAKKLRGEFVRAI